MVTWVLIWLQMGVDLQHYQIAQFQTQNACYAERERALMIAPQDNQILHCLKIYTKGR